MKSPMALPPEPSDAVPYMRAFHDLMWELVERARKSAGGDTGYEAALMEVLGLAKDLAREFELDAKYLGLADFDPEQWFARNAEKN
jgi:hypothetical protein